MQVNYQPLDDTPDKVEAAIRKYQELSSLDKNTEAYRRAYAAKPDGTGRRPAALGRAGRGRAAGRPRGRHADRLRTVRAEAARLAATDRRPRAGKAAAATAAAAVGAGLCQRCRRRRRRRRRAAAGRRVGPPGPRGHRRRSTGSGRIARPSGRTTAAARLGLRAGRGSSGPGAAGPAAVAAARAVGRHARRRTVRRRRPAATASPTAPPRAPSTIRPTIRRGTCRRRASSRRIAPDPRLAQNAAQTQPPTPAASAGAAARSERRRRRQDAGHGAVRAGRSGLEGPRHRRGPTNSSARPPPA